jgi:integrase
LPVVLARGEVAALLGGIKGTSALVAKLLYGSGLRLLEALTLRVKDVDLVRRALTVRDGKGRKDRITVLPEQLVEPLKNQIEKVRRQHARDIKAEGGG